MVSCNTKLTSMFTITSTEPDEMSFFKFYCNICLPALTSTHIPWIHKCDIKTVECGTSHKDTNIQIFSVEHYKYFTKMLSIILAHKLLYFKAQCFLCCSFFFPLKHLGICLLSLVSHITCWSHTPSFILF